MMVTTDRATAETTEEILSDIQSQGAHAAQIIDRHRTMLRVTMERNRSTFTTLSMKCLASSPMT